MVCGRLFRTLFHNIPLRPGLFLSCMPEFLERSVKICFSIFFTRLLHRPWPLLDIQGPNISFGTSTPGRKLKIVAFQRGDVWDLYVWLNSNFPPTAPINHVKIFKGWPPWDAPSKLVQLWYKSFPSDQRGQVEMKKPHRLSNKTSTAWSCADDEILENQGPTLAWYEDCASWLNKSTWQVITCQVIWRGVRRQDANQLVKSTCQVD